MWIIGYTVRFSNVGECIYGNLESYTLKTKELAIQVGRNIKAARIKRGIKQEQLCESAAIDRSYLSRVENGNCKVALEKVYQIALALNCTIMELLPDVNEL